MDVRDVPTGPFRSDDLWLDLPWAVWDTETTGLDPQKDRVLEVAVVQMQSGLITDRWSSLINPGRPIPAEVAAIHGITDELIQRENALPFKDVAHEFIRRVIGRVQVGYNAITFDSEFMRNEIHAVGEAYPYGPMIDPLVWVRHVDRYVKGSGRHKLGVTASRWGITLTNSLHRAAADADLTCHILRKLAESDKVPATLGELLIQQEKLRVEQEKNFQAWKAKQPKR